MLSGVVDGMAGGERTQLLSLIAGRLAPGGTLVIHSVSRDAWEADSAPPEADLAPGRPLRPDTWTALLEHGGYESVAARQGPGGQDFLVIAIRASVTAPYSPPQR